MNVLPARPGVSQAYAASDTRLSVDSTTFRAVHRYGAVLSVAATAVAVLAFAVNGQDSVLGLFLGWAGPLGVFYFGGATLTQTTDHRVVGEELLRGVAWYFGSLVAWSVILTTTDALAASPATVFGLPALTALAIVAVMVATRHVTGRELTVRSPGGQLLVTVTGVVAFGVLALYLVLADHAGWWLVGLYLVSVPVGVALRRVARRRYPGAFAGD